MDGPLLRQPAVWSLRLRFQAASCSPVGRVSCLESHLAPGPFCLWGRLCFLSLRWAHSLSSDAAQPPHVPRLLFTPWRFRGRILTSHPAAFSHYCQSWSSAAHLFVCWVIPACVCVCVKPLQLFLFLLQKENEASPFPSLYLRILP